ncbi:diaminopropionate ammonia-lyase [Nitratireductor aquimarinus]|uniref:diaminopropionate ammonia-lyase n=1 Tax=Nitratireductor TaxID=245876 RepID=UPI0019D38B6E|nr:MULTISPECIES: diaminopropionate ammonia-lyase [Nitratireductor]MBN7776418.1 diaminopropionate ammonia-lyase [Nitratireductor pacificus]MBN7779285.1 diaminopropionate ammonia-lyase [Nitratireductor pacificus]MBN7788092.1 diaminopropionate ammonia-lyase [Nitratireductor aquimarinus]MBY6098139.1 diaminopropionate ammonia-lyase [Nitratireductor aquimarinus]MCA1259478.1 diaminopropionate ammonia-lyase [Nitratireductor aquimarinus]
MFIANTTDHYGRPLSKEDRALLGPDAAVETERFLSHREGHVETPLQALPGLARELGVGSICIKDEGFRLGLGSFKALGGSYAVIRLALEEASRQLERNVDVSELQSPDVRAVSAGLTVACATDGNHGRSVAQGARLIGARAMIFIHSGVSQKRADEIARFGAEVIRVEGNYDESVAEASRVAEQNGWTVVSDTAWPGYERIPGLVMQGYVPLLREALRAMPELPTHVFIQAGVGGVAAAIAGHLAVVFGSERPRFVVVEPSRAACVLETARADRIVRIEDGEATVMAMLECYEPSLVAWRILTRVADGFMTVDEDDAVSAMKRLGNPAAGDTAVVAGESGGVGLAGLIRALQDETARETLQLGAASRVFLVNTEGDTDPELYEELTGLRPDAVRGARCEPSVHER